MIMVPVQVCLLAVLALVVLSFIVVRQWTMIARLRRLEVSVAAARHLFGWPGQEEEH